MMDIEEEPAMIVGLLVVCLLSLTAWTVWRSRPGRSGEPAILGLMSQQWISEQRAAASQHRLS